MQNILQPKKKKKNETVSCHHTSKTISKYSWCIGYAFQILVLKKNAFAFQFSQQTEMYICLQVNYVVDTNLCLIVLLQ